MRIFEFSVSATDAELKARILTVIEFLRNRDHDKKIITPRNTSGFINMVNNQLGDASGATSLNYELLDKLKNSDQALGQLITSLDQKTIEFKPFGDEPDAPQEPADDQAAPSGGAKDPTKTVDAMAKRAAANRS